MLDLALIRTALKGCPIDDEQSYRWRWEYTLVPSKRENMKLACAPLPWP
jgi:hypothetical protein